jgi:hypothetical protein
MAQGRPLFCPVPHNENGASEGLRVLLEKPARELCSILSAWRNEKALCSRLGDQPLARPVSRDDLGEFAQAVEQAREWPELSSDQQTLLTPLGVD